MNGALVFQNMNYTLAITAKSNVLFFRYSILLCEEQELAIEKLGVCV